MSNYLSHRGKLETNDLFVSAYRPNSGLDGKGIAKQIEIAIRDAGFSDKGLTPGDFHRSVGAAVVAKGLGWNVARLALGYSIIPCITHEPCSTSDLIGMVEDIHPMSEWPPES